MPLFIGGLYLNALAQSSFDATVRDAGIDLSLYRYLTNGSGWVDANRSLAFAWFLVCLVVSILVAAFKDDKDRLALERALRPIWELERQYQCLLGIRQLILHPDAPLEDIKTLGVVQVGKIRSELLNLQGVLFSPSTAATFHRAQMFNVAKADPFVVGLTHPQERRGFIAEIDLLLASIHRAWADLTSALPPIRHRDRLRF